MIKQKVLSTVRVALAIALLTALSSQPVGADEGVVSKKPTASQTVVDMQKPATKPVATGLNRLSSIRVETPFRLVPRELSPDLGTPPPAGVRSIAYLNEDGELVAPPPGSFVPGRLAPLPQPVTTFMGTSPGGGIGIDISHITSYSFATIGADGTLQIDCVTGPLDEAQDQAKETAARRKTAVSAKDKGND